MPAMRLLSWPELHVTQLIFGINFYFNNIFSIDSLNKMFMRIAG
jgi:hypothetical protein